MLKPILLRLQFRPDVLPELPEPWPPPHPSPYREHTVAISAAAPEDHPASPATGFLPKVD